MVYGVLRLLWRADLMTKHAAIVGVRVGDEGKGVRVVHYAQRMMKQGRPVLTYRWHGAANAGHTVVKDKVTYRLHQVPAGIVVGGTYNLQGAGVYINPRKEVEEIGKLREQGLEVSPRNLGIASNCTVTFDFHTDEDRKNLLQTQHTSTGNGVKQTAVDLYNRTGVRFAEFLDAPECARALHERFNDGIIPGRGSIDEFVAGYEAERNFLAPFMVLESEMFERYADSFKLGEGAHGFDLDVIEGLYPGVTSSHPSQVPRRPDIILGAIKLYDSSVGHNRPFVSRLADSAIEAKLRDLWGERGTTTGKDRYIGWADMVAARHAIDVIGVDYLVGNCGDRLTELHKLGKSVGLVTAYEINGVEHSEWDASFHKRGELMRAKPVVEWFEPWNIFVQDNGRLHPNAQRFIDRIQELTRKEFVLLGTGSGINDVLEINDIVSKLSSA